VISTYLAVSTLADLGMLNLINVTKTAEWLMSCQASNAAFKPYPAAGPTSLPGYSSLVTNPFDVDHSGTGVPYTYAAVEALRCIGKLDSLSQNDKESIKEYLLSCQNGGGNFYIHADSDDWHNRYTYYAVITLRDIGMLDESQEALIDVVTHISDDIYFQELQLDDAFPLPVPRSYLSYKYGMFQEWSTDPLEDTFYAVMILNTTGNLGKLDQFTPRAQRTALYLLLYSAFAAAVATVTAFTFIRFQSRRKHITTQPSTSQGLSQLG
jgi:hypothetical protein